MSNKIKQDSAFAKEAFLHDSCDITYVVGIFDYKSFYDKYVDKWLMMRKENYTQLGMIFQKLNDKQKIDNPHLIEVFVNYKKLAQDVGVDLQDNY